MKLRWIAAPLLAIWLASAALGAGCGNASVSNPFGTSGGGGSLLGTGGGVAGGAGGAGGAIFDAGQDADPELGGPCLDDGQCDDMIACTFDSCDTSVGRCRFVPDDSLCQDGLYCDGVERCDLKLGCVAGIPVDCGDGDACNIVACVEATQSCSHTIRDADGDGDPDWHCPGGHDCNDDDPNVNSHHPEVCDNGIDDNCNGLIDEVPCVSPSHDTCLDPLQISASGTYAMTTVGAKFDYPTSCGLGNMPGATDVVAAVVLPAGPLVDVEVTAETQGVAVAVAIAGQCGDPSTEIACGTGFATPSYGMDARARGRGLGSATQMTAYPVYVETAPGAPVSLDVQILPPVPAPANLTCGTAAPITPGVPLTVEVLDGAENLGSACATQLGQQVFAFDLAATSDIDVYASSVDGDGLPLVSLRDAGCALPTDEITCLESASLHMVRHSLVAGTYYLAVSASAATTLEVTVDVSSPTAAPPDQTCTGCPVLTPNQTLAVSLAGHEADVSLGCLAGAVDAAYELDLAAASDVLVVERIANGDTGAAGLALPACTPSTTLLCTTGTQSPLRSSKRNVPAGPYRVVAESLLGEDVEITAFVRNAVPPTLVLDGDGCGGVFAIPSTGGFFQGNTANAQANFPAGCDEGGVPGNGAPDQLLELTLTETKRVVLDMEGSAYNTILDVRQGDPCPGVEVANACAVGFPPSRSYLDLQLDPGTYYIQVDGFELAKGQWFLDVRVVDP
jgi:Putative metal-binding motif